MLVVLAALRLSDQAICEASKGDRDFHDYPDSITPLPWHMHTHTCKRCGKQFSI